jgi:hypothetical protein
MLEEDTENGGPLTVLLHLLHDPVSMLAGYGLIFNIIILSSSVILRLLLHRNVFKAEFCVRVQQTEEIIPFQLSNV